LLFFVLVAIGYLIALDVGLPARIGGHFPSAFVSFTLLLAPIWFFGFGAAEWMIPRLPSPPIRIGISALAVLPYVIFSLPRGQFRWSLAAGFLIIIVGACALLETARGKSNGVWQDLVVLGALGLSVDLRFFQSAWPYPGISGLAKLVLVGAALYGYLVIRKLDGVGYDFRPRLRDVGVGLREYAFFAPIAISLGLALRFLHWRSTVPSALTVIGGWVFTFLLIAIPEELFFRGLVQNLLARRFGASSALLISSVLFGLSHFNKRISPGAPGFNWRYVLLAAIAGIFYGRAWMAKRRLLASGITHTTVDLTWSIWLR
jgi:uncharacterized protein